VRLHISISRPLRGRPQRTGPNASSSSYYKVDHSWDKMHKEQPCHIIDVFRSNRRLRRTGQSNSRLIIIILCTNNISSSSSNNNILITYHHHHVISACKGRLVLIGGVVAL
jgi:hypothetical protein